MYAECAQYVSSPASCSENSARCLGGDAPRTVVLRSRQRSRCLIPSQSFRCERGQKKTQVPTGSRGSGTVEPRLARTTLASATGWKLRPELAVRTRPHGLLGATTHITRRDKAIKHGARTAASGRDVKQALERKTRRRVTPELFSTAHGCEDTSARS